MNTKVIVRVFFSMAAETLMRTIKLFIDGSTVQYVDTVADADLIITDDVGCVERGLDEGKSYAFINVEEAAKLPARRKNVKVVPLDSLIADLLLSIDTAARKSKKPAFTGKSENQKPPSP